MKYIFILILIAFFGIENTFSQAIYKKYNYKDFRKNNDFQEKIDIDHFDAELLNACIFFATNEIRAKKHLPILKYNTLLEKAASSHSGEMAKKNFFSHYNETEKKFYEPNDRARVAGISNPHLAENIIEGFILEYKAGTEVVPLSPGKFALPGGKEEPLNTRSYLELTDQLLDDWMHSKGHKANILSVNAIQLGCGTTLFLMKDFNDMPAVKATQCFQEYKPIEVK